MNKKILFTLGLLSIMVFLSGCGGGGGGSLSTPSGTNAGVPSVIKLLDVQHIAQTNSTIYLKAKVLDGNGQPVQNVPVTFTNLSAPFGELSATLANTDAAGIATVTLNSSLQGFSSIMVEVTSGAGQVRNVNTVFFTSSLSMSLLPTMILDVDGNDSNTIYNEPGDYNLFETSNDTQVTVRASVFNSIGLRASGVTVTFGSDFPFSIGSATTCSDGSSSCAVSFPFGNTATTDFNGEAFVLVQVAPNVLSSTTTVLNITAIANNGAFNVVSLFLNPVIVNTVVVRAAPTTVDSDGTSDISATVTTSTGAPVPDGTTVNFTSTAGALDTPFAQTEGGVATTTLTAPTTTSDMSISVTASVGGKSGSTSVSVTGVVIPPTPIPLTLTASVLAVDGNAGGTVNFTVAGGVSGATYTSTSGTPAVAFNDNGIGAGGVANNGSRESGESGLWTGPSFTATIESCTGPAGTVVISATDGTTTVTKTITIQNLAGTTSLDRPTVAPTTATIYENGGGGANNQVYNVTQGTVAVTLTSLTGTVSNAAVVALAPAGPQPALTGALVPFTATAVTPNPGTIGSATTVNLLFTNNLGCKAGATVSVINE